MSKLNSGRGALKRTLLKLFLWTQFSENGHRYEILPSVSLWRREASFPTGYKQRKTKLCRIMEKNKQDVLRGNSAKCRSVSHKLWHMVAAGTGTSWVPHGRSEGRIRRRVERVPGFMAPNQLELLGNFPQPKETARKTFCCESQRTIIIAGAKQEEPEKQFLSPIQQLCRKMPRIQRPTF